MIYIRKILALFIIFMMLVPFVCAGDTKHVGDEKLVSEKPTTEKVTDKTKEKTTEITSKDKSITGKITVTDTDISKYKVEKKSSTEISISKEEAKGEHTKAKVSISKSELQKIDIDKDGKFGLLHISDTGEVTHTTATEAELVAGKEMTFSENIVNGYSGYKQYTFSDVESGDTLNIEDVSGNYTITAAVDGVVPEYVAGIPTSGLVAHYNFTSNAQDSSGNGKHGTPYYVTYANGGAVFDGVKSNIIIPSTNLNTSFTIIADYHTSLKNDYNCIVSQGRAAYAAPYNGFVTSSKSMRVGDADTSSVSLYPTQLINRVTRIYRYNSTSIAVFDNVITSYAPASTASVPYMGALTDNARIGRWSASTAQYMNGTIYDLIIYSTPLNLSQMRQAYAGGSGISFQPEPSYNWTGYNVASGVEKVLNTDDTCTGIEYVDTTGGTHDVTITVYFTKDITVISDSHTATMQTVNISHTSSNTAQDGELIPYDILDEYFGTIDFDTTNPNATITRNATHFMVDTGHITANTTYYYNVSIPNYVEEMVWSDWNPDNETCNAKLQIGNSTPYTTWNITTYNVTNGSLYKLVYASNGTEVGNATAANGSASIIILGLVDGVYWLTEIPGTELFLNPPFVITSFVIVGGGFVIASWLNQRRKRGT